MNNDNTTLIDTVTTFTDTVKVSLQIGKSY